MGAPHRIPGVEGGGLTITTIVYSLTLASNIYIRHPFLAWMATICPHRLPPKKRDIFTFPNKKTMARDRTIEGYQFHHLDSSSIVSLFQTTSFNPDENFLKNLWNSSVSPPVFRNSTTCKEGATSNISVATERRPFLPLV